MYGEPSAEMMRVPETAGSTPRVTWCDTAWCTDAMVSRVSSWSSCECVASALLSMTERMMATSTADNATKIAL